MTKYRRAAALLMATCLFLLCPPVTAFAIENVILPDIGTDVAPAYGTVSSGEELLSWLETNKYIGGTVKLTDDVTLEGNYKLLLVPECERHIYIDTDIYTITVKGEVNFGSSDMLITFYGQGGEKGLLHVAPGGSLSLIGATVEAAEGRQALFQEEGAALILDKCKVTGAVHYAETPIVLYECSRTVVAEPWQSAADVLPTAISCRVNRRGNEDMEEIPVTWNLAGYEELQEARHRFTCTGSFQGAASLYPPVCTVAYNDYPLTFTRVDAMLSCSVYFFKGEYITLLDQGSERAVLEYSFDMENWNFHEDSAFLDNDGMFEFYIPQEEWDVQMDPYVYIRLCQNDNGMQHYSNVLRYEAADLSRVLDVGGTRGGGTGIITVPRPPLEPEDDTDPVPEPDIDTDPAPEPDVDSEITPDTEPDTDTEPDREPAVTGEPDTAVITQPDNMDVAGQNAVPAAKPDTAVIPGQDITVPLEPDTQITLELDAEAMPVDLKPMELEKDSAVVSEPVAAVALFTDMGQLLYLQPQKEGIPAAPIAAGCATVAVCMAAAGLYLHPQVLQRAFKALKRLFRG